jgi:hypothetical protein
VGLALVTIAAGARAQQTVPGFALDRLYLSAPGGGWFAMDTLDMHGGLGGVMSLTTGYAHDPFRVSGGPGAPEYVVVADEALANFGFAATYDRYRLYLDFAVPLDVSGQAPTVGRYRYTAPNSGQAFTPTGVNPSTAPDAFADGRIGFDVRLYGRHDGPLRLGLSAQLFVPSPNTPPSEYLSDGTFRAMDRVLFAGDVGRFTYAAQLGAQFRQESDPRAPGTPEGSELLFGAAGGVRVPIERLRGQALIVGPEVYGESAFRSLFGKTSTGLEGLVTGRLEGTADDGPQLRFKLGAGGGIDPNFGSAEWRVVAAIELFDRHNDRDHDGVSDSKDACPDVPGAKSDDGASNGCPRAPQAPTLQPALLPPRAPQSTAPEPAPGVASPPAGAPPEPVEPERGSAPRP